MGKNINKKYLITSKYCVSKDHKTCKRYLLKEKGEEVPINLHPDGYFVDEWSK